MQSEIYPYINDETVGKLLDIADRGFCSGLGTANSLVCVEAAWYLARGGDPSALSDQNECVGSSVRAFRIPLNDKRWSSPKARAAGMRRLALAGLGSAHLDQATFSRLLAVGFIREILPIALRAAADLHPAEKHQAAMRTAADRCAALPADAAAAAARYAAAAARYARRDETLGLVAELATRVLCEMGSEGSKFLPLIADLSKPEVNP